MKKLYINRIVYYDEEVVYENVIENFLSIEFLMIIKSNEENLSFSFLIILQIQFQIYNMT
jgi:hypothetical protein